MSSKNNLKVNFKKYPTKKKKIVLPYLFDIEEIDKKKNNFHSCEKMKTKNNIYQFDNIEITNNIFKIKKIDDLPYIPLKNLDFIFSSWKISNKIFKNFEQKILQKNDFKIDYKNFDIITKNGKSCKELKDEQFWMLFSEFLFKNGKVKDDKDFLKIMNNAFSSLDCNCSLLIYYYFDKIKKIHPIIKDGKIEVKDELYFDLLNDKVKNRIKYIKENLNSNIKISSNQKYNNKNIRNKIQFYEYSPTPKKFQKLE